MGAQCPYCCPPCPTMDSLETLKLLNKCLEVLAGYVIDGVIPSCEVALYNGAGDVEDGFIVVVVYAVVTDSAVKVGVGKQHGSAFLLANF